MSLCEDCEDCEDSEEETWRIASGTFHNWEGFDDVYAHLPHKTVGCCRL